MVKKIFTKEMERYLEEISPGRYNREITDMFNKKFDMNKTVSSISSFKTKCGIKSYVPTGKKGMGNKLFNVEEEKYLQSIIPNRLTKEVSEMFNNKFKRSVTASQVANYKQRSGITSGVSKTFLKGTTPWNKGKSMPAHPNSKKTQFKKGQRPVNHHKVGTEVVVKEGYISVKVAEPNVWKLKHRIVYEEHYGKIPPSHVIILKNGNKKDTRIENLTLISRAQLAILNKNNLLDVSPELIDTSVAVVDLMLGIGKKRRKKSH